MSRLSAGLLVAVLGASSAQGVGFTVGTSTSGPWLGFMNVFELPVNGGGFVFGSTWGTPDLVSSFNDGAHTLTLSPNTIGDPNPFWYTPSGGPGSSGNKVMEANLYVEHTNQYAGETISFSGTVLSSTLLPSHTAIAFIKDFAPDYSSFVLTQTTLPVGPFSITTTGEPGAGRHIQYGFQVVGPCVWVTDVAPYGNVVIQTVTPNPPCHGACVADYDDGSGTGTPDGGVTIDDLIYYLGVFEAGGTCADVDDGSNTGTTDGGVTIDDLIYFLTRFEAGC